LNEFYGVDCAARLDSCQPSLPNFRATLFCRDISSDGQFARARQAMTALPERARFSR
jgi:hypothetical protein